MQKREITNLNLKVKLTKEYLENGGIKKIFFPTLLSGLMKVKSDASGNVDPDSVNTEVNAFMGALLQSHLSPPFYSPEYLSEYRSTLQKSNNFTQENIDTAEQFDKMYEEYKCKSNMLFRGQREAKWRLYSTLQRNWIQKRLFETENSYQRFIEKLVSNGKKDFDKELKQLLSVHNIDTENDISVLGYLQHHSCPTPLLDWTFKFQNALFFAIDGLTKSENTIEIENYCSVYFIEEKHFESGSMRKLMNDGIEASEPFVFKKWLNQLLRIKRDKKQ